MTIHETVALWGINEPIKIKTPEGIENAGNFKKISW